MPAAAIGFRLAHELEGLLRGIRADERIAPEEASRIVHWLEDAASFRTIAPFSELATHLDATLADGQLTLEEVEDLLWVVEKYTTVNPHFDALRSGLQILMGFMAGIESDRQINPAEITALSGWIDEWNHLAGLWPYDECEAVVTNMIVSKTLEPGLTFLRQVMSLCPIGETVTAEGPVGLAKAICAVDPFLSFDSKRFVVTGESSRCPRSQIENAIVERNGQLTKNVSTKTDYLIVCDANSPHWAFACYGRKIEEAYRLRRQGHQLVIAHEADLWDAVASTPRAMPRPPRLVIDPSVAGALRTCHFCGTGHSADWQDCSKCGASLP